MSNMPIIKLIGDPEESFYQLGIKDRETHLPVAEQMASLLSVSSINQVNNILTNSIQKLLAQTFINNPSYRRHIEAYAEGLNRDPKEVNYYLLLPEIMSAMSKWLPTIPRAVFGCSSYFSWDTETDSPIHTRLLDFPLTGTYEENERVVHHQLKGFPALFSYSTAGFPYPSLTVMTSEGTTLALHQKFTDIVNLKGMPIFELVFQLLREAHTKRSAIEFLKKHPSLTTWCMYMCFKDGSVLAAEPCGEQYYFLEDQVEPGKIIYFNNQPHNPKLRMENFLPNGYQNYCEMREQSAHQKMTKLKKLKKLNELKHLQILGTPTCTKGNDAKKWNFDATALSTVNLSTLNPVAGTSMTLPGNAPKVYSGEVISFKNIWEKPQQDLKDSKKSKTPEEYNLARRHFITAQSCFDTRDYHGAYHNIQMATDYYSEHVDRFISQFYFLVFQYLHEDHLKIRAHLLEEFRVIKDKLPTYLADHCLIFIARLERINSDRLTIKESDIQATNLKTVLRIESKWPRALVLKMSRALTFPRIDCLDVIYGHAI